MTETTRRNLLRSGVAVAALAPLAPLLPAESATGAAGGPRLYRRSRFTPLLGKRFRLVSKTGRWRMTLLEVTDLSTSAAGSQHAFGLTFHAPAGGPTQGSYLLIRSGFTDTPLFVVPADAERGTYQAVINNL